MAFNRQQLEAIAAYEHNETSFLKAIMVIEPQFSASALCTFNEGGKAEAYRVWEGGGDILADSQLDVKGLGATVKSAVKSYYLTGMAMDSTLSPSFTVSSYMDYYGKAGGDLIKRAVDEVKSYAERERLSVSDMRFVFVGEAADFFPAEAMVRIAFLDAMPMAVSSSFKLLHDTENAVAKGESIQSKFNRKVTDGRTEWSIIKDDGTVNTLLLADTDTPTESLLTPIFTKGVFAFPDDTVKLNVKDKALSVSIPEGVIPDRGGLLHLALVYNEGFSLVFRCDGREATAPINITLKGEIS